MYLTQRATAKQFKFCGQKSAVTFVTPAACLPSDFFFFTLLKWSHSCTVQLFSGAYMGCFRCQEQIYCVAGGLICAVIDSVTHLPLQSHLPCCITWCFLTLFSPAFTPLISPLQFMQHIPTLLPLVASAETRTSPCIYGFRFQLLVLACFSELCLYFGFSLGLLPCCVFMLRCFGTVNLLFVSNACYFFFFFFCFYQVPPLCHALGSSEHNPEMWDNGGRNMSFFFLLFIPIATSKSVVFLVQHGMLCENNYIAWDTIPVVDEGQKCSRITATQLVKVTVKPSGQESFTQVHTDQPQDENRRLVK